MAVGQESSTLAFVLIRVHLWLISGEAKRRTAAIREKIAAV
jgi:hypothetical protein